MFATPAAPAAPSTPAVQSTFAEQLNAFARDAWAHLVGLDAREAAVNALISVGVVLVALGVVWLLRRLFDHWLGRFLARAPGETPDDRKRTPKAAGVTWGLVRLIVLAAAVLLILSIWGIDPWAWLSHGLGARLARLALILVLATALIEVAGFVIRRMVEGVARRSGDGRRAAQIRTLGPLLTGSVQAVLLVVSLLTFLSEVGVKVGPLLASAGVFGIAVGFGAQSIVKDFLTGLFLIVEDVVSVGDNIRIGEASGTVEAMTLRTIRLRNQNGTLHIFPYSEAQVIHNRTSVFSSYLVELTVNYDCDLDLALQLMAEVGDAMGEDPEYSALITRPFEVMGVDRLTPTGAVLKARFTTRPRGQWKVGREYNRRIKKAFADAGIDTALMPLAAVPPESQSPPVAAAPPRSFDTQDDRPQS
jgi:small conductance mechanosensitive channel